MVATVTDTEITAGIAAVGLIVVALIQNGLGFRRGSRERSDAMQQAADWREEVRSEFRSFEDRLAILNAKLDGLTQMEDEHENGHLENGGR